ncbi:electron transfer flavoprotein subunit beta/FixA family protein [Gulosibacter chungangensis]|uniref:Electron transfer flavoprotein subunit beta n=1 Tax=Gulosibacter chungangensis TaxID=979746 RepID=A0A7J5BFT4_9MICO|nr:electron transfer flavoprotein subunit beta/FixA family protein [Gulosibacter chungangensis]KAB1645117.1 electron transfer flavoprotein subunit beta/FixA family protein [Gulosibacter chungangensis]
MKIVVLVKEVPDTYGARKLDLETGLTDRGASDAVIDEINERAIEAALSYATGKDDTEVVIMSMAPAGSTATVRKGLAMGASSAVHIADEALAGSDLGQTADVLAAALRKTGFDLVITGNVSTDGAAGMVPAMLAELLEVSLLSGLDELTINAGSVSGVRPVEGGSQQVSASLPAVISVTESMPDGRLPNFKGIMAAKKKPLEVLTAADLGINPEDFSVARSIMITVSEKPPREGGIKIEDSGDAGEQLANFLVENRLV